MKKIIFIICLLCTVLTLTAKSYENNKYQQESIELTAKADAAFASGDFEAAIRYANEAEENARLSAEYIKKMMERTAAFNEMCRARTRLAWAKNNKAAIRFPEEYKKAQELLKKGDAAFNSQLYDDAVRFASEVLAALSNVTENAPLPAQYIVRSTKQTGDCLWNIAKNPAVYGDPFKWKELYRANKSILPDSKNPNWLEPGLVLTIPSLNGEFRSGTYDPDTEYIPYKDQIKK